MEGGPKVAWDTATKVITSGISANLPFQTAEWNAAMAKGDFAVLACPAWMQGYIQGQAPKTKGNWDIAAIPGGGGSWGGSFFSVPKQGKNVDAAYDFIKFATSSEQQINVFQAVGLLPSQPVLYKDAAIQNFKNPFFNNAPVGQIFTTSALNLKPQYLGRRSGAVRVEVSNVLTQVQQGKVDPAQGWELAKAGAEKASE
jgi:cellobiose transport system substrate-binding protein